jgi:ferredoxin
MTNLLIAVLVFFVLVSGPLVIFTIIKLISRTLGGLRATFVKLESSETPLGLKIEWDSESYPHEVYRVRVDFYELIRGGRSTSFSYTFEGKSFKRKSFVLPLQLTEEQKQMLTDSGLDGSKRSLDNSQVQIEIETTTNETERYKIAKRKIIIILANGKTFEKSKTVDILDPIAQDRGALLTRVFAWKKVADTAEEGIKKAGAPKAAGGPAAPVNFLVTKVWIEPGCIVCDACENEAPDVFWVKDDTCIVRDNAPLDNAGAIAAAAEGCPVDVIKFTTAPKP